MNLSFPKYNLGVIAAVMLAIASSGCQSGKNSQPLFSAPDFALTQTSQQPSEQTRDSKVQQVGFQESENEDVAAPPVQPIPAQSITRELAFENSPESAATRRQLSLSDVEGLVLEKNPAVTELEARLESLNGKHLQAGLGPNPTLGIVGSDINEDGSAGRYGAYYSQKVIRGNKLGFAQSVVSAEICALQQQLQQLTFQLRNQTKTRFYELLVAKEKVNIATNLLTVANNATDVSRQLWESAEAAKTALLQAELESENAKVFLQQAKNQETAARRRLAALFCEDDLQDIDIVGDIKQQFEIGDFEVSFDRLVNESPELLKLFSNVETARRQLALAQSQTVPDLTWQTSLQYDFLGDRMIGGFQVGMPLMVRNLNQGNIYKATYDVVANERTAEKKALELRQRLVSAYESYVDAKIQLEAFEEKIIPKAKETLDLVSAGYREGEIEFLQLLTTQRTFFQTNLLYLQKLNQLWQQSIQIEGLLINDMN